MRSSLSADAIAQLKSAKITPFVLLQGKFVSGYVNLWTGLGQLSWNGVTWQGLGSLIAISPIGETTELQASGVSISLSGIPSDLLGAALTECKQGYPVTLWLGFMTDTGAVVADPAVAHSGRMDTVEVNEGGDTSTITITVENRLIDLQRARSSNYTDEEQQRLYPGDKGFQFVAGVQSWNGAWGKK
jgi:hypothetical protein